VRWRDVTDGALRAVEIKQNEWNEVIRIYLTNDALNYYFL